MSSLPTTQHPNPHAAPPCTPPLTTTNRDLSYFKNEARLAKGIEATEAFVKEKHQHFERNREKKVRMVERMRQKMIDEARERVETEGPKAEEKMSTFVANEKRNVEKQRDRQKKELQNMLAFELRRQQIEEENRKKAEEEARKEEAMRKERLKKEKEWEEHQRQMVLEKMRKQIEAEELARIKAIEIAEENARQEAEALEKERRQKAAIEEKNRIAREIRQKKRAAAEKRNREIQDELIAKREEMERQVNNLSPLSPPSQLPSPCGISLFHVSPSRTHPFREPLSNTFPSRSRTPSLPHSPSCRRSCGVRSWSNSG